MPQQQPLINLIEDLTGDLNEWFVWGRPLRWLVSHFEPVPAPPTFPSRLPVFALDRLWISPRHRLVRVKVHATPLARRQSGVWLRNQVSWRLA